MTSVVYFVRAGDFIKIGTAVNVEVRVRALQTANAVELILLGTTPGDLRTETEFHLRFAKHHVRGEWFRAHEELVSFARALTPLEPRKASLRESRHRAASAFVDAMKECGLEPSDLAEIGDERLIRAWMTEPDRRPLPLYALMMFPRNLAVSVLRRLLTPEQLEAVLAEVA